MGVFKDRGHRWRWFILGQVFLRIGAINCGGLSLEWAFGRMGHPNVSGLSLEYGVLRMS